MSNLSYGKSALSPDARKKLSNESRVHSVYTQRTHKYDCFNLLDIEGKDAAKFKNPDNESPWSLGFVRFHSSGLATKSNVRNYDPQRDENVAARRTLLETS